MLGRHTASKVCPVAPSGHQPTRIPVVLTGTALEPVGVRGGRRHQPRPPKHTEVFRDPAFATGPPRR
jgi:hypothetical protein